MKYNITLDKYSWMMFGIGQIIPKWPNWFGARNISSLVNPLVISHYISWKTALPHEIWYLIFYFRTQMTYQVKIGYILLYRYIRYHDITNIFCLFIYYHILLYKNCFRVDVTIIYIYIYIYIMLLYFHYITSAIYPLDAKKNPVI